MLDIRLLGSLELWLDDFRVQLPALKPRLVLICLATSPGFASTVDALVDAVWGDEPPKSAVNSLHVYVSTLRHLLGPASIISSGQTYSLDPSTVVDLERLEREVRAGTEAIARRDDIAAAAWLSRGLSRWRGTPLATEAESDYVAAVRSGAIELWLYALEGWADVRTRTGHALELTEELAEPVRQHPFREVLRARYIVALGASGRQTEALAEYGMARSELREALGVEPGTALAAAQAAVLRNELPELVTSIESGIRLGIATAVGTLIGREKELESLERLVHNPSARVVTVLGHGGIGKTRLAQELVLRDPANSAFVSLTAAERTEDIVPLISTQLGVGERERPIAALVAALSAHAHALVLVFDNLEHLPEVSSIIAEIVSAAPLVTVVATSRIPLGMPGERRLALEPLDFAFSDEGMSPAAELLLDRVWSYNESFVPSVDDLAHAAALAERCEGIPLSLEMVAARTSVFTLAELRERLEQSLLSLVAAADGDFGTASTGAVVRWSISLLTAAARNALGGAATFRGGFTANTLAGVLGWDPEAAAEAIHDLVAHSLITSTTIDGVRRFDILEVIREVVRGSLSDEDAAALDDRHVGYFLSTLDTGNPDLLFPASFSELEGVAADRSNYRHAVNTALQHDMSVAGELIDLLGIPWMRVGSPLEMQGWIDRFLASGSGPAERRMACLIHLLRVDQLRGGLDVADIFREIRDIEREVPSVNLRAAHLAYQAIYASDRTDAVATAAAVKQFEPFPQTQLVIYWRSVARLSHFVAIGDDDGAIDELTSFVDWARPLGLELQSRSATQNLIYALLSAGRYAEGVDLAMDQLDIVGDADIQSRIALLEEAGEALLWMGEIQPAITNLELAAALSHEFGSDRFLGDAIVRLAAARVRFQPNDLDAAFLAGIALAWIEQSSVELDQAEQRLVAEFLGEARDSPDRTPVAEARNAGRAALLEAGLAAGAERAARRGVGSAETRTDDLDRVADEVSQDRRPRRT